MVHTHPTLLTAMKANVNIAKEEAEKQRTYDISNLVPLVVETKGRASSKFRDSVAKITTLCEHREETLRDFWQGLAVIVQRANHQLIKEAG